MDLTVVATGYLHSPSLCHGLVAQDLAIWAKPHSVSLFCYDGIMKPDCLAALKAQSEGSFADMAGGGGYK